VSGELSRYTREEAQHFMNLWGARKRPFIFIIDYEMEKILLATLDELKPDQLLYNFNARSNEPVLFTSQPADILAHQVLSKEDYFTKYNRVLAEINKGNSYLLNLSTKIKLSTPSTLLELYKQASAKYKLYLPNQFICFSPETFIKTVKGEIFTHPMKGTINASDPEAREKLLADQKENAEHATIVDLMRNDLSMIAQKVTVSRFKYLDKIESRNKSLWQMSSEIRGTLKPEFTQSPGDLLFALLPAGSISGAPKKKTAEIIQQVEGEKRNYYTGICGIFDGQDIDSGVMIRFIEKEEEALYYRTGGGLTAQSNFENEFQELIDKIYVPTNRDDSNIERKGLQHSVSQSENAESSICSFSNS